MEATLINQLSLFGTSPAPKKNVIVNVGSVPKRSPFRYPGGKTWLVPTVRKWLKENKKPVSLLIEPFAGGGIIGLTAAFEKLAEQILMVELDPEIAAVWETIFSDNNEWLSQKILQFDLTIENAKAEIAQASESVRQQAFSTILKNRICHGGIIAKGAGFLKNGENGKGIKSRWYAKTLHDRIAAIQHIKKMVEFREADAFQILEEYQHQTDCFFFIDPPYTVAGKRLYTMYDINHVKLFEEVSKLKGHFMLTYDDTEEIRDLAQRFGLKYQTIPMKTTHHSQKNEIIIANHFNW